MLSRTGRGGGGEEGRPRLLLFLIFIFSFLLATVNAQNEFGYGPKFDPCGDNCQTQLLHFCTELRDAQQQKDCWCGVGDLDAQYVSKMDACLATCDPKVSNERVQRDVILRYRNVVCRGDTSEDPEFKAYYLTRYGGDFAPEATKAAPLPPAPRATTTIRGTTFIVISPAARTSTSKQPSSSRKVTATRISTRTRKSSTRTPPKSTKNGSTKSNIVKPTTRKAKLTPTPTIPTLSASDRFATAPTYSSPHETSTLGSSKALPSSAPKTLSGAEIAGISIASLAGFVSILIAAACLYRVRNRKRDSKANYIWSPITPIEKHSRNTPDSLGKPTVSTGGGIKNSLAKWLGWRPEPPELDIHPQYTSGMDGVPTIRVQSPTGGVRKVGVSPPMMMANSVGLAPVMHGAHHEQPGLEVVIPDSGPQQVYAETAYPAYPIVAPVHPYQPHPQNPHDDIVSPLDRRDIILPPIPHAVTTPSGYYHAPPPRPFSEATGFTECTSETDDMSQSEWTDYGEQTDSANRRRLDQLLEEVDLGYRGTYAEMYGDIAQARPSTSGTAGRPDTSVTRNTSRTGRSGQQPQLHGNLGYF